VRKEVGSEVNWELCMGFFFQKLICRRRRRIRIMEIVEGL